MRLNRYRVLEYMDRAGFATQGELADALGVSRQALSQWLKGSTLTLDNLGALCQLLHCTPNDILVLNSAPKVLAPMPAMMLV
jgi:DNA-binding Xre family transcriptional regulator